jgi:hypothetical protein
VGRSTEPDLKEVAEYFHVVRLDDGGFLVGGGTKLDDGTGLEMVLVRYRADGTLNARFGAGGIVRTRLGGDDEVRGVLARPDGTLLVAARVKDPNDTTRAGERIRASHRWALLRCELVTGARDLGFGGRDGDELRGLRRLPECAAGARRQWPRPLRPVRLRERPRVRPLPRRRAGSIRAYGGSCAWETEPAPRVVP